MWKNHLPFLTVTEQESYTIFEACELVGENWAHSLAHSENCEKQLLASSCLSICPFIHLSINPHGTTQNTQTWHLSILWNSVKKIQVWWKSHKNNRYITWRLCTLMIISQWNILRMRFQTSIVEKIKTHILYSIDFFFPPKKLCLYKVMQKDMVQPDKPQMAI